MRPGEARDASLTRGRDLVEIDLSGSTWAEALTATTRPQPAAQTVWRIPLDLDGIPPAQTAQGRHDDRWVRLAATLTQHRGAHIVRLESPDSAAPATTVEAFRAAARPLRAAGVLVEWGVTAQVRPERVAALWPGGDVVDLVGVDVADTGSWSDAVSRPGGLADWTSWARERDRRLAVHWSVSPRVTPAQVRDMHGWLGVGAGSIAYETAEVDPHSDARTLSSYRDLWRNR